MKFFAAGSGRREPIPSLLVGEGEGGGSRHAVPISAPKASFERPAQPPTPTRPHKGVGGAAPGGRGGAPPAEHAP